MKMVKKDNIFAVLRVVIALCIVALYTTACQKSIEYTLETTPGGNSTISFNLSDSSTSTRSFAATVTTEREIRQLGLIFYNSDGEWIDYAVASVSNYAGLSNTGTANFDMPSSICLNAGIYTVLVITNGSYDLNGTSLSLNDFLSVYRMSYKDARWALYSNTVNPMYAPYLPFGGETTVISDGNMTNGSVLSANLTRAVAKIQLQNLSKTLFIDWVRVMNYRDCGTFFYDAPLMSSVVLRGGEGSDFSVSPHSSSVDGSLYQLIGDGLYCYPNISTYAILGDTKTTCLMVAGYWKEDGWAAIPDPDVDKLTYYRINVAVANGENQVLNRNSIYPINVLGCTGHGSDSEDDAYESLTDRFVFDVDDWEPDDEGILTDKDGNYMIVSPTLLVMSSAEHDSAYTTVKMSNNCTWTASISEGAEYFEYMGTTNAGGAAVVRTVGEGHEAMNYTGKLLIQGYVNGVKSDWLLQEVSLLQSARGVETMMLSVDSKLEDFGVDVDGNGEVLSFTVVTGSPVYTWTAEVLGGGAYDMIDETSNSTFVGGNNSLLKIVVKPNNTATTRVSQVAVSLNQTTGDGSEYTPIIVTITQERSTRDVSVSPAYTSGSPLYFYFDSAILYNITSVPRTSAVTASFNDQVTYNGVKVTVGGATSADVTLSRVTTYNGWSNGPFDNGDGTYYYVFWCNESNSGYGNQQAFTVNAFAPYPTQPNITAQITVEACYVYWTAASSSGYQGITRLSDLPYYFETQIINNLTVVYPSFNPGSSDPYPVDGHAWVWFDEEEGQKLYIFDRNAGVDVPELGDVENLSVPPYTSPRGYNYNYYVAPEANTPFQGGYYNGASSMASTTTYGVGEYGDYSMSKSSSNALNDLVQALWRTPNRAEQEAIVAYSGRTKDHFFVTSQERNSENRLQVAFFSTASYRNSSYVQQTGVTAPYIGESGADRTSGSITYLNLTTTLGGSNLISSTSLGGTYSSYLPVRVVRLVDAEGYTLNWDKTRYYNPDGTLYVAPTTRAGIEAETASLEAAKVRLRAETAEQRAKERELESEALMKYR